MAYPRERWRSRTYHKDRSKINFSTQVSFRYTRIRLIIEILIEGDKGILDKHFRHLSQLILIQNGFDFISSKKEPGQKNWSNVIEDIYYQVYFQRFWSGEVWAWGSIKVYCQVR